MGFDQIRQRRLSDDIVEQLERYGHKDILVVGGVGKSALCRASAAVRILELKRYRGTRQSLAT